MRFLPVVLLAILGSPAASAADVRPTPQSVRQLFELMHTSAVLDTVMAQIDTSAQAAMLQATAGEPPSEEQKRIMSDTQARVMALMKQELDWAELEPLMIEVYRDGFTQKEVDGMLKFYRSDTGQAVIAKLPVVMQGMMQRMQVRMQSLTPRVVQLEKDAIAQLRATARPGVARPAAAPPAPPATAPP
ncbi:MAG: DUF2059 domain-containing protein, partial [Gammaproteobacteria bacterium]|nr:DUF2059 domain-containing protein [Gammaproteobacteria bacterium]